MLQFCSNNGMKYLEIKKSPYFSPTNTAFYIYIYKVSRQSKQLLQLRNRKADINLQKQNPALFNFLDELGDIKVGLMKSY